MGSAIWRDSNIVLMFLKWQLLRSKYIAQLQLHSIQLISSRDIYFSGKCQIHNRRGKLRLRKFWEKLRFLMKITPETLQLRFSGGCDIPVWNEVVCVGMCECVCERNMWQACGWDFDALLTAPTTHLGWRDSRCITFSSLNQHKVNKASMEIQSVQSD